MRGLQIRYSKESADLLKRLKIILLISSSINMETISHYIFENKNICFTGKMSYSTKITVG